MLCDFRVYHARLRVIFLLWSESLLIKLNERVGDLYFSLGLLLFVHVFQEERHLIVGLALVLFGLGLALDEVLPVEFLQIPVYLEIKGHKRTELPLGGVEIC